jgi:pyridoxamine 5'-phosphate oxidase family protein
LSERTARRARLARAQSSQDTIDVGGHDFAKRKKYRNVQRNPQVAMVIDDPASIEPWRPRMIEARGEAETLPSGGESVGPGFDAEMFRIRPRRIISIGIAAGRPFVMNARSVN